MIYYIPIEPYESRYTKDWLALFPRVFAERGLSCRTVEGQQTTSQVGRTGVFSPTGTNHYKATQIQALCQLVEQGEVKDGDIMFFADLWFPGIEALFYIRNITKIKFRIVGILHAGTWDYHDFTTRNGMRPWGHHFECALLEGVDEVYVATWFHRRLIFQDKSNDAWLEKIKVTGIPFYASELALQYGLGQTEQKSDIVVFPHRIEAEKRPDLFDLFADKFSREFPNYTFVKTLDVCNNREQYFQLLANAKVMLSFAEQETFGFSTVEAMALGCKVLVPNALSYRETVPYQFRYDTLDEAENKLRDILAGRDDDVYNVSRYDLERWAHSIDNMISHFSKL